MLRVSLVQIDLFWEDPVANLSKLEEILEPWAGQTDLVVLPEMFTTGFSMNAAKNAEIAGGHTHKWLIFMAKKLQASIAGSYIIKESDKFYNRLLCAGPSGQTYSYNKRHLFRMGGETEAFHSGTDRLIVEINGVNVAFFICYDLRFPVWSRNINLDYDVAVYVANWPASRTTVWQTLLPARAIENLAYSMGVNRVGRDAEGIEYIGRSLAFDYKGNKMIEATENEHITTIEIDKNALTAFRGKFPAHLDADPFTLNF